MYLLDVGLVNMIDWVLFLATQLFVFHPMSTALFLCSRCEWLVAVECREWSRFLHSLRGWLGGVEWRADICAQGTLGLVLHMRPCWKGRGASEVTQLNWGSFFFLFHTSTQFVSYIHTYLLDNSTSVKQANYNATIMLTAFLVCKHECV